MQEKAMPITTEQKAARQKHLGSSDIAAVLGVNPWSSAYEVWLEKTGRYDGDDGNAATTAGNDLEPVVLSWAEDQLGRLDQHQCQVDVKGAPIRCHIDALLAESGEPVEAKTSGIVGPVAGNWGDGGDAVPDYVLTQCMAHLMATGKELCYVPALLGGRGYCMYEVPRSARLCDWIGEQATKFWDSHVLADVPPPDSKPALEILKKARRQPGRVAQVQPDIGERYRQARQARLDAEKVEREAIKELLAIDPDATAFEFGDPDEWITYFEQSRKQFVQKKFEQDYPELAKQYTEQRTHRVLRVQKRK
jgi:putative phage-type endonuclease